MTDLFRISAAGQLIQVPERPFLSEVGDLEDFLVQNPHLLGEGIEIVGRQVNAGPAGRIDLLAIDKALGTGQVAVVELKNEPADARVLLQALRYASWVVSNPDSVRLLLEKSKIMADEVDLKPTVIVVAPVIQDELLELTQYVGSFEFDLVELRRFEQSGEHFVAVTRKSPVGPPPPGVTVQEEWSWEKYASDLGWKPDRIQLGQALFQKIEEMIHEYDWPLRPRFRKGYIPFQLAGTKNVVGLEPRWAQGFSVWFRLPRPPNDLGLTEPSDMQTNWSSNFKVYYVNVPNANFDLFALRELFATAYEAATGGR